MRCCMYVYMYACMDVGRSHWSVSVEARAEPDVDAAGALQPDFDSLLPRALLLLVQVPLLAEWHDQQHPV